MLTVACVRTGSKYPIDYVLKLRSMVARHLPVEHRFMCLTDRLTQGMDGIHFIDISSYGLEGWWAKLLVFNRREIIPAGQKVLFIDLDMVVRASLLPLVTRPLNFGICRNFTQLYQQRNGQAPTWPCKYGSCVMLLGEYYGQPIWDSFDRNREHYMEAAGKYGDQKVIEMLNPAGLQCLQDHLPEGYFQHYRDFGPQPDERAAVLVFAGSTKPTNPPYPWAAADWR